MAKVDPKKMNEMANSKLGKYTEIPESKFSKYFYIVFLKNTPLRAFLNGCMTAGIFVYWFFSRNSVPLMLWVYYLLFISICGLAYWHLESRRLDSELKRTEHDLDLLRAEIQERKKYFTDLKKKIEDDAERGSKPK